MRVTARLLSQVTPFQVEHAAVALQSSGQSRKFGLRQTWQSSRRANSSISFWAQEKLITMMATVTIRTRKARIQINEEKQWWKNVLCSPEVSNDQNGESISVSHYIYWVNIWRKQISFLMMRSCAGKYVTPIGQLGCSAQHSHTLLEPSIFILHKWKRK